MSNKDAKEVAGEWLAKIGFTKAVDLTGQTVDLTPHLSTLKYEGHFRRMVVQAVEATLKRRGVREIIGLVG